MQNIIEQTCKELGLTTYKQLGEKIGYSEGRLKQLAITKAGKQVQKVCEFLLKCNSLEKELKTKSIKTITKRLHKLDYLILDCSKNLKITKRIKNDRTRN